MLADAGLKNRHCERNEAIQGQQTTLDCFAALAMTANTARA
jgi:hypothetical protein